VIHKRFQQMTLGVKNNASFDGFIEFGYGYVLQWWGSKKSR